VIGIAVLVVVMLWLIGAIVTLICLAIVLGVHRSPIAAMSERDARRYVLTLPATWPRRLARLMRAARSHVQSSHQ
jgi:hypothetical protein